MKPVVLNLLTYGQHRRLKPEHFKRVQLYLLTSWQEVNQSCNTALINRETDFTSMKLWNSFSKYELQFKGGVWWCSEYFLSSSRPVCRAKPALSVSTAWCIITFCLQEEGNVVLNLHTGNKSHVQTWSADVSQNKLQRVCTWWFVWILLASKMMMMHLIHSEEGKSIERSKLSSPLEQNQVLKKVFTSVRATSCTVSLFTVRSEGGSEAVQVCYERNGNPACWFVVCRSGDRREAETCWNLQPDAASLSNASGSGSVTFWNLLTHNMNVCITHICDIKHECF